jgi:hypothetical protein
VKIRVYADLGINTYLELTPIDAEKLEQQIEIIDAAAFLQPRGSPSII